MSRGGQTRVSRTQTLPKPTEYVKAIYGEFANWCFDEEAAPKLKGRWREEVFKAEAQVPMDFEIGTGNGYHFSHRAVTHPERLLLGVELKYKPLIQTIRRAVNAGAKNSRVMRWNAVLIDQVFSPGEINDVIIHFPDPWEKLRQHKHRLIQKSFLESLFASQKPGSLVEFKTDNRNYYLWAMEHFAASPYVIERSTDDLHASPYAAENFVTQFESIFLRQGLKINYARLRRN